MWRIALLGFAACYHPAGEASCGVRCASDGSCPGSLRCSGDGVCIDPSGAACGGSTDARVWLDAPADMSIDAPPGCYGHLGITLCDGDAGSAVVHPAPNIDTTTCTVVVAGACVVAGLDIDIDSSVTVRGSRPIIFFARQTLTIEPSIVVDVASDVGQVTGPGGNDVTCSVNNGGGSENGTVGAGGGAGGSWQGGGGVGGSGAGSTTVSGNGALPATPSSTVSTLRGGCRGGDGGGCTSFTTGGLGGDGGGAVYFLAGQLITVDGSVNASGAGGGPAEPSTACGAGGGGSGGLIVLDAPTVSLNSAVLLASGGGGGGSYAGGAGKPGNDPDLMQPTASAGGGTGDMAGGGDGGAGSSATSFAGFNGVDGVMTSGHTGGGGGGGGAGFVWAYAVAPAMSGQTTTVPALQLNAP